MFDEINIKPLHINSKSTKPMLDAQNKKKKTSLSLKKLLYPMKQVRNSRDGK